MHEHTYTTSVSSCVLLGRCACQVLGNFSLAAFRKKQQQQEAQRAQELARFQRYKDGQQDAPAAEQQAQQAHEEPEKSPPQWLYVSHQLVVPITRVLLAPPHSRTAVFMSDISLLQSAAALPIPAAPSYHCPPLPPPPPAADDTLPPYANTALSIATLELRSRLLQPGPAGEVG